MKMVWRMVSALVCFALYGPSWADQLLGPLQIPVEDGAGFKPQVIRNPDGTEIDNVEFYRDSASHLAVGRSSINGPALPRAKINYTDVFYLARGSAQIIQNGRAYEVKAGDFILLPRGMDLDARNFKKWVHLYASFETGAGVSANGPIEMRRLNPGRLKRSDFTPEGDDLWHEYYSGADGVVVRAWQSKKTDVSTEMRPWPYSELMFIVSGSAAITTASGKTDSLKAGDAFLIPKGTSVQVSSHRLRKLSVLFAQG
jgi:mannose-6-phosphate isomerase-like protein (cupin superfamily)